MLYLFLAIALASLKSKCTAKPMSPDLEDELGRGVNGVVYHGIYEGREVAIKEVKLVDEARVPGELEVMQAYSQSEAPECLIRLKSAYLKDDKLGLVMEFVDGVTLQDLKLPERMLCRVIKSVLQGVNHLHDMNWLHRDIKPENIMISRHTGAVKLLDFGMACKPRSSLVEPCGSIGYASPEVLFGRPHGKPHDIWSVGATAFHLHTGLSPLHLIARRDEEILQHLESGTLELMMHTHLYGSISTFLRGLSDYTQMMISMTLKEDPESRPTAIRLLCGYYCLREDQLASFKEVSTQINQ